MCRPKYYMYPKWGKANTWERPVVLGPRVKAEVGILKGPDTAFDKIQHPFIPSNKILGN